MNANQRRIDGHVVTSFTDDRNYEQRQINYALSGHPEQNKLTLKISGDTHATRILLVTPDQVRKIREILGEN